MKYTVLVSFSGAVSAVRGQVIELNNKAVIKDLTKAGYIKQLKESKTADSNDEAVDADDNE